MVIDYASLARHRAVTARWGALLLAAGAALQALAQEPTPTPAPRPSRIAPNLLYLESTVPAIPQGEWSGPRLSDGQPDVQGHWANTIANHNNFTDPQGGIIGDPNPRNRPTTARDQRAPSRVSDPADGQLPLQPWAAEKIADFQRNFNNPTQPQYIEPLARCAPAGVPKSLYWHGYEIRQYPGHVLFLFNSGTRIIRLGGAHLPDALKLWNGDSRGHWEGNTLVVDVSNLNGKALFGRSGEFTSENAHVVERYVFSPDGRRYNYVATFTDPSIYTRPFTVTIPARRFTIDDKPDGWHFETIINQGPDGKPVLERPERICVENNGPFGQVAVPPPRHR